MNLNQNWHGKPYYSLDSYCKNELHCKVYKIALDAHMTCPNRDGTLDTRGCIFCSAGGSGEFAVSTRHKSIEEQIAQGRALLKNKKTGTRFIAYFQAYTNTYAPVSYLKQIYTQALNHPEICGISIATRPDCLPDEVLKLLISLKQQYPQKWLWVELGLQTVHDRTALFIRRGYSLTCYEQTFLRLRAAGLKVITHIILGLPGETKEDMYQSVHFLNRLPPFGVKLQLLHVLKYTDLADYYQSGDFDVLSKNAYLDILIHCLELLSPEIVVHRVTGDGPKDLLLAPLWSRDKRGVLNALHQAMRQRNTFQGNHFQV